MSETENENENPDTLVIDEDAVINDKKLLEEQNRLAMETVAAVEKSIVITEKDKEVAEKKKKAKKEAVNQKSDDAICLELQNDLEEFIKEKIDLNVGDANIDKLPTGIDILDAIMGGGFGVGTFSLIVGLPGTFKSALLGQVIGEAQKKYNGKVLSTYHDSESAMTKERLKKLGVTRPEIKPYDDVTVESVFKTIEAVSAFKQLRGLDYPAIVAWDSIVNTSTEKERTTDDINKTIGLRARLLSSLFPRYIPKMRQNKVTLIAVNQLREKLDMGNMPTPNDLRWMGDKVIPGGFAVKFNAFHLLFLKVRSVLKVVQYGFSGVKLEAKCIKNKFFMPNVPVEILVDFNTGMSNFWTNYNFLANTKRIQAGAWNFLISLPQKKFRTVDALGLYNTNEDGFKDAFDADVKQAIATDILKFNQ